MSVPSLELGYPAPSPASECVSPQEAGGATLANPQTSTKQCTCLPQNSLKSRFCVQICFRTLYAICILQVEKVCTCGIA